MLLLNNKEYVFQNQGVPFNYQVQEEEAEHQIFGLMRSGRSLLSFAASG